MSPTPHYRNHEYHKALEQFFSGKGPLGVRVDNALHRVLKADSRYSSLCGIRQLEVLDVAREQFIGWARIREVTWWPWLLKTVCRNAVSGHFRRNRLLYGELPQRSDLPPPAGLEIPETCLERHPILLMIAKDFCMLRRLDDCCRAGYCLATTSNRQCALMKWMNGEGNHTRKDGPVPEGLLTPEELSTLRYNIVRKALFQLFTQLHRECSCLLDAGFQAMLSLDTSDATTYDRGLDALHISREKAAALLANVNRELGTLKTEGRPTPFACMPAFQSMNGSRSIGVLKARHCAARPDNLSSRANASPHPPYLLSFRRTSRTAGFHIHYVGADAQDLYGDPAAEPSAPE